MALIVFFYFNPPILLIYIYMYMWTSIDLAVSRPPLPPPLGTSTAGRGEKTGPKKTRVLHDAYLYVCVGDFK